MAKKSEKEVLIKIDGKEWEKLLDDAFKKANKRAKIDGFRPGKAPKSVYIKHYGLESLYYEASNAAIEVAYGKLIDQEKDLQIVAEPNVTIESLDEKGIEFKFVLTLKPEVKLGKYKGLIVKKETVKVTKEEVEHSIEHMREHYKENVTKDGKIENGDIAIIDFEGFKDGVPFDGGKGENYSLEIGSNTFIPGFEEQLIGLKAGDEKDLDLTFPEDYHSEELKGQKVVFKVKVEEVKEVVIPELDKEFFEDLGMDGIDTKEALEKQVKENIKAQKEKEAEDKYNDALIDEVAKNAEYEIPEAMIEEEKNRMIREYSENLRMQGISLEQFFQFTGMTEESLKAEYTEAATKRVTFRLIIDAIIEKEKIDADEKEVDKEIDELSKKYNMTKEEFTKQFGSEMIRYELKVRKVLELLKGE
jgi:trigger factor